MKALITGGAGFIGSHLAERLLEQDFEVTVLDNFYSGDWKNVTSLLSNDNFKVIFGSILDSGLMETLIGKADIIFHLAAVVGLDRVCPNPAKTLKTNIMGTEIVLDFCRKSGVKIVLASSSETYGKSEKVPLSESDNAIIGATNIPRWSYALSKLADEEIACSIMGGVPVVILRFFNTYGPRVKPSGGSGVIIRFINQALNNLPLTVYGDGEQERSYTYIDDTISGILAAARQENEIFNIGNPKPTTINEVAKLIKILTGSNSKIIHLSYPKKWGHYEEIRRRVPDISHARNVFDFQPQVRLEDGLRKTIHWARGRLIEQKRETA